MTIQLLYDIVKQQAGEEPFNERNISMKNTKRLLFILAAIFALIISTALLCGAEEYADYGSGIKETDIMTRPQADGENASAEASVADPSDVINMLGYSVRTEGKNGIRAIFSFDLSLFKELRKEGYSVVEFGAIVSLDKNKTHAVIDKSTLEAGALAIKLPAYTSKDGYTVIREKTDNDVSFAVSVVNIPVSETKTGLYMTGYAVLKKSGSTVTVYAEDEKFDSIDLYTVSLEMYKQGLCTSTDASDPIWAAVSAAPAVTLKKGEDYTVPSYKYTVMGGGAFGDTFEFRNVPTVRQQDSTNTSNTPSTGKITCYDLGGTISLYEDAYGDYVMIMTGAGQSIPAYGDLYGYSYSAYNYVQYSNYFLASATEGVDLPNPILTEAATAKIKYIVLTEGITILPVGTFTRSFIEAALILPASLNNIQQKAFAWSDFTAIHVNADGKSALESDVADLSNFTGTLDTRFLIQGTQRITKLHLPSHITEYTGESFKNALGKLQAVWVGDADEPSAGVADFTPLSSVTIGCNALFHQTSISTVILPDDVTINAPTIAWNTPLGAMTIMQAASDKEVSLFCENVGYSYTDLSGEPHTFDKTIDSFKIGGCDISEFKIYALDGIEEAKTLQAAIRDSLIINMPIVTGASLPSGGGYIILDRQSYAYHDWSMTLEGGNLHIKGSYRSFPKALEALTSYFDGTKGNMINITASDNISGKIPTVKPLYSTKDQLLKIYNYALDNDDTLYGEHWGGGYGFAELEAKIKERVGSAPAILAFDMIGCYIGNISRSGISQAICEMLEFSSRGGIITTYCHWQNPNEVERMVEVKQIDGTFKLQDSTYRGSVGSYELWQSLFVEGSEYNRRWKAQLTFNAEIYQAFKDLGLPVTFRPMIEANSGNMWWCYYHDKYAHGSNAHLTGDDLRTMWNYVYDYYVNDLGLDNILWTYSPNPYTGEDTYVDLYYPGADRCDIVGMDWYIDSYYNRNLITGGAQAGVGYGYDKLTNLIRDKKWSWSSFKYVYTYNKPIGLCEWGVVGNLANAYVPDNDKFNCSELVDIINTVKKQGYKIAFVEAYSGYFGSSTWIKGGEALRAADGIILLEDMPSLISAALG